MNTCHRPWVIVAIFSDHKPEELGRTYHRADAEAHVRFLQRYVKQGAFYVMFDPEDSEPVQTGPSEFTSSAKTPESAGPQPRG